MKQEIINKDWEEAIKDIDNNVIDLVVTDPPYGMSFKSNFRKVKHKAIQNDNDLDWLSAQTHFNLQTVNSKRQNGKEWSKGVGRVLDGGKYLTELHS